jgi:hypothetical protein
MAGCFFFCSTLITPMEVTVGWSFFLATYGVTLVVGLLGLAGFFLARNHGESVSPVYARCCSLFIISVCFITLAPVYRLRWHLVFP